MNPVSDDKSLLEQSAQYGMSADVVDMLLDNVTPMTSAGAIGVAAQDIGGDSCTIYLRLIDKSSSMYKNRDAMIDAANFQVQELKGAKTDEEIIMSTWLFDTRPTMLHSFVKLQDVTPLDATNYAPAGGTAIYDAYIDSVTSLVAYVTALRATGMRIKITIVLLTDGEDWNSNRSIYDAATVTEGLLQQEIYLVALVAFGFNAESMAAAMGIRPENVIMPSADGHGIRTGLGEVSKSVVGVSRNQVGTQGGFFSTT